MFLGDKHRSSLAILRIVQFRGLKPFRHPRADISESHFRVLVLVF